MISISTFWSHQKDYTVFDTSLSEGIIFYFFINPTERFIDYKRKLLFDELSRESVLVWAWLACADTWPVGRLGDLPDVSIVGL